MEGEGRDGYRDQIVTCDVGVSLKRAHWQGMPGRGWRNTRNKVKSIGGAAYVKAKDSFSQQHRGACSSVTLSCSGSTWRLRYTHRDVWREPVHALLGRCSYQAKPN